MQNFSFTKMHLQTSSTKWQPFCPWGDELMFVITGMGYSSHQVGLIWDMLFDVLIVVKNIINVFAFDIITQKLHQEGCHYTPRGMLRCWWLGDARNLGLSQYKDHLSRYRDTHYKDKKVSRLSYVYNGNPFPILPRWHLYIETASRATPDMVLS